MSVSDPLQISVVEAAGKNASKLSVTLDVGASKTVSANKAVTWKSSNAKIAKVTKKVNITGKKKGKCTITLKNGKNRQRLR